MTLGQNGVLRYCHFIDFGRFLFGDKIANLGPIDFKIGLFIKVTLSPSLSPSLPCLLFPFHLPYPFIPTPRLSFPPLPSLSLPLPSLSVPLPFHFLLLLPYPFPLLPSPPFPPTLPTSTPSPTPSLYPSSLHLSVIS